jgi:hypothetical protein
MTVSWFATKENVMNKHTSTEALASQARWPYRVIVRWNGDIMGSPHGIPCESKEQAEAEADKYRKRNPKITVEIKEA